MKAKRKSHTLFPSELSNTKTTGATALAIAPVVFQVIFHCSDITADYAL